MTTDESTPLLAPRDGLPKVVTEATELKRVVTSFAAADGPVAWLQPVAAASNTKGYQKRFMSRVSLGDLKGPVYRQPRDW